MKSKKTIALSSFGLTKTSPHDNAAPTDAHLKSFGVFRIVRELGRGGMGVVYEANHTLLKKRVALKVISESHLSNPTAIERFLLEIEAIGKLSSPHIVAAFDAGEVNGTYYLVMEYVDGPNLKEVCDEKSRLSVANACQVVSQTAQGLDHAHQSGLIHRDIKPSNLMVDSDGVVKVADLGLAKAAGQVERPGGITDTGGIVGTLNYISPEQIEGKQVDARTDQYALGCAFYHLLTGKAPFSGPKYGSTYKKIQAHINESPPPPSHVAPDIPGEIDRIVARLMAKNPDDRWPAVASLNTALEPFLADSNLSALVEEIPKPTQELPPLHDATRSTSRLEVETVELQSDPENSWAPMIRWLAAGGIIAVLAIGVLLAANWSLIFPDATPIVTPSPHQHATAKDYTNAKINEPIDLLQNDPAPLFSTHAVNFEKDFERTPDRLALHSFKTRYFSLGNIQRDSYTLEFKLQQKRWVGGFGIFFGYYQGEKTPEFHCLNFGFMGPPAKQELSICRKYDQMMQTEEGAPFAVGKTLRCEAIPAINNTPHTISIHVIEGKLKSVQWNNQKLAVLTAEGIDALSEPMSFQGQFGIAVSNSDILVNGAKLTIESPPHTSQSVE